MPSRTSIARTGVRILTSVVVLAAGVVAVTAAASVPWPSVTSGVPSVLVTPVASDQTRVCSGPLLAVATDGSTSTPTLASIGGTAGISAASPTGTALLSGELATPDTPDSTEKPQKITATGADGVLIAGSQSQQLDEADLTGLASSACAEATAESWLVSGSTTTGRSSTVVLSNPTAVSTTVSLTIYTEAGLVQAPGANGIIVPANSQKVLTLAGLAPDAVSPVIHVTATGGRVLATLQQSVIRSLDPGGVDVAGPTEGPALTHTIPGVQIVSTSAIAERATDAASSDLPAALRVYVPGAAGATLSVTLKSETLGVPDVTASYSALAGVVTDFPFPSLPDDDYSITVASDQPVVVGARSSVVSGGTDFAWYQASPAIGGTFLFTTPIGPSPRLMLANSQGSDAAVTLTPAAGEPITATVAGNSAAGIPISATMVYTVTTSQPLSAAVGFLGDGLISAYSISPPSPLAAPVTVYPGG
ncbi:DUF5719 family protein [Subtercola boreus]|uniref:Large extracellular alpha-helical protein n=1 Tax=Subtercola boreus TaxID=120213 RepID=A0A3E0WFN9_9MICO|nr:DUF5719 family protein [Subtercola boreus]RFA22657.1 hypothetical protein B7R24_03320 [Subtercola boreus]RFA23012.1 hypothetical protein B7R23_03315 [Subtercola boreus]RFA28764.1 hypothetical protein B7R25_03330 [Subtercola boreus]